MLRKLLDSFAQHVPDTAHVASQCVCVGEGSAGITRPARRSKIGGRIVTARVDGDDVILRQFVTSRVANLAHVMSRAQHGLPFSARMASALASVSGARASRGVADALLGGVDLTVADGVGGHRELYYTA